MEKYIKFSYLLSAFICLLSFAWLLKVLFLGLYPDFSAYYHVSEYFLKGINYYAHPELLTISYSYPPIDFLFFVPFTFLPFQFAEFFWTLLNIFLLILSILFLTKIFKIQFFSKLNMILMALVFISFPTKFTLGMGQLNIIVMSLLCYGLWVLSQKKESLAGIIFGAAFSIKFSPVFLPFYFLIKFKKRVIIGMLIFAFINILLVLLFVPFSTTYYYIVKIAPDFLLSSWKLDYYNQSITGVLGRSLGTGYVSIVLKNVLTILFVFISFVVLFNNKKKDLLTTMLSFGIIITISILFNTFSWQHHFVWLIVPFYATVFYLKKIKAKTIYYLLITIAYVLVSVNFPNPNILPVILQSHVFYGGIILLSVDLFMLLKRSSSEL